MSHHPKHPDKELREVTDSADAQGWTVQRSRGGYFMIKCPCPGKHKKTVHVSPSNPRYKRELLGFLRRSTCWKEETQ